MLLIGFVVQALGIGVMLAGVPYYSRQVLGDEAAGTLLFAALVGPAILVMPLWLRVSRRLGKRTGLLAASALFAVGRGRPRAGAVRQDDRVAVPLVVLVGIGYAGMQMFPLAMLPDVIAADEAASGERRAGVFTGVWTAAETLGLAVGPGLLGGLLAVAGYVSSTGDEVVAQSGRRSARRPAGLQRRPAVARARQPARCSPATGSTLSPGGRRVTPDDVLAELTALQAGDLPTHGGGHDGVRLRLRARRTWRSSRPPRRRRSSGPTRSTRRRSRASPASRTTWSAPPRPCSAAARPPSAR